MCMLLKKFKIHKPRDRMLNKTIKGKVCVHSLLIPVKQ